MGRNSDLALARSHIKSKKRVAASAHKLALEKKYQKNAVKAVPFELKQKFSRISEHTPSYVNRAVTEVMKAFLDDLCRQIGAKRSAYLKYKNGKLDRLMTSTDILQVIDTMTCWKRFAENSGYVTPCRLRVLQLRKINDIVTKNEKRPAKFF